MDPVSLLSYAYNLCSALWKIRRAHKHLVDHLDEIYRQLDVVLSFLTSAKEIAEDRGAVLSEGDRAALTATITGLNDSLSEAERFATAQSKRGKLQLVLLARVVVGKAGRISEGMAQAVAEGAAVLVNLRSKASAAEMTAVADLRSPCAARFWDTTFGPGTAKVPAQRFATAVLAAMGRSVTLRGEWVTRAAALTLEGFFSARAPPAAQAFSAPAPAPRLGAHAGEILALARTVNVEEAKATVELADRIEALGVARADARARAERLKEAQQGMRKEYISASARAKAARALRTQVGQLAAAVKVYGLRAERPAPSRVEGERDLLDRMVRENQRREADDCFLPPGRLPRIDPAWADDAAMIGEEAHKLDAYAATLDDEMKGMDALGKSRAAEIAGLGASVDRLGDEIQLLQAKLSAQAAKTAIKSSDVVEEQARSQLSAVAAATSVFQHVSDGADDDPLLGAASLCPLGLGRAAVLSRGGNDTWLVFKTPALLELELALRAAQGGAGGGAVVPVVPLSPEDRSRGPCAVKLAALGGFVTLREVVDGEEGRSAVEELEIAAGVAKCFAQASGDPRCAALVPENVARLSGVAGSAWAVVSLVAAGRESDLFRLFQLPYSGDWAWNLGSALYELLNGCPVAPLWPEDAAFSPEGPEPDRAQAFTATHLARVTAVRGAGGEDSVAWLGRPSALTRIVKDLLHVPEDAEAGARKEALAVALHAVTAEQRARAEGAGSFTARVGAGGILAFQRWVPRVFQEMLEAPGSPGWRRCVVDWALTCSVKQVWHHVTLVEVLPVASEDLVAAWSSELTVISRRLATSGGPWDQGAFAAAVKSDPERAKVLEAQDAFLGRWAEFSGLRTDPAGDFGPRVVPVFHGCHAQQAEAIAQDGFGNLSRSNGGFFGNGVYATEDLQYAAYYAAGKGADPRGLHTIFFGLAIAGNSMPIVYSADYKLRRETPGYGPICDWHGQPLTPGAHSHITSLAATRPHDGKGPGPFQAAPPGADIDAREIVVRDEFQILPLALLYVKLSRENQTFGTFAGADVY
jgi:hypothetical protein